MKKLTAEGRFECGLDELTRGRVCALTPVISREPGEPGIGLGLAIANEPGFYPIPMYWVNSENWYEMDGHASELNLELFGLDEETALKIVASSMRK